jgi:hypothetical protein
VIITTKSGAVYTINNDTGVLQKKDADGDIVSTYKVFMMKAIPLTVSNWDEVYDAPQGKPEVGKLLYTVGMNDSWLSTEVVSIDWEGYHGKE